MWLFGYAPRALHASNIVLHIVNGFLVYVLSRRLLRSAEGGLIAALMFSVLPGLVDAVAWVSAVTALLMTFFFVVAMLAHLAWLESGRRNVRVRTVSFLACVAALLTHEGAVTLLPMMLIAERFEPDLPRRRVSELWRSYAAFAAVLAAHLVIAWLVNRSNPVVLGSDYRVGVHAVANLFEYVRGLYVRRRGLTGAVITAAALVLVGRFGSTAARLGAAWMLITLLPYAFFTTPGGARYMYLAGIGFSLMVAGVLQSFRGAVQQRAGARLAWVAAVVLTALLTGRFALFAWNRAPLAVAPGEAYRAWFESFRRSHGVPARGAAVPLDSAVPDDVDAPALPLLLRLEYGDPSLQVEWR